METGGLQDLTRLLFRNYAPGQEPAQVFFQSDTADVPEPSSLELLGTMLGTGLLGLRVMRLLDKPIG